MEQLVPARDHSDYALLWDLADEMAKQDHRSAEVCWLAIMDAFWVGKLSTLFLFFPRAAPGRALKELPSRSVMALLLLGPGRRLPAALRGWTVADYQKQPTPFGEYFARNPRFGLAIRRADFDRCCAEPQRGQGKMLRSQPPAAKKNEPKRRPGPEPGALRRYEVADRALFPKLEHIMETECASPSAAALVLAEAGEIRGVGIPESRARRLAALYARERKAPA